MFGFFTDTVWIVGPLGQAICMSQQVEVLPSLVTDCKKLLRRNRLFWGLGIGNFEV